MPKSTLEDLKARLEDYSVPLLWRDFVSILKDLGFDVRSRTGGSARLFFCGTVQFIAYEAHGRDKTVGINSRKKAVEAVRRLEGEEP
jgi:hypothetical protein